MIGHDLIGLIEEVAETLNVGLPFLGTLDSTLRFLLLYSSLGVSLLAIVPTITEIINACKFALNNQIGTSIEIGSTVAVQTALLQIPLLIVLSEIISAVNGSDQYALCCSVLTMQFGDDIPYHVCLLCGAGCAGFQLHWPGWKNKLFHRHGLSSNVHRHCRIILLCSCSSIN